MSASRRAFLVMAGAGATGLGMSATSAGEGGGRLLPLLSTHVAGTDRYAAPGLAGQLSEGAALGLRREPENRYDARAISVWAAGGHRLGYVPRIHNQALANMMDAGLVTQARIVAVKGSSRRPDISIAVAVEVPGVAG